ncbi:ATP-binding cassette domain-containing protein [Microbacterium terricola]|uniref:ABC transporter ATP-binding protein n=1 Tax=Microbacterium terricola TaxID=344163 RepID=A0ABM8E247_9MICO|nr:ATP-binding cassette domain-containing protein [Microbacterium terricola]UYK40476.1 ATP-binding cassette domain-containing protein [Microbacterium terricola]BDV31801.1 ABC transporter ATP-binding protein [Microbacterium terricola]
MSTLQPASERAVGIDAPLLEVRNLVVRYGKKGPAAVDDVSFTIARGETLGLVGESGSGKTTIGRAILGLQTVTSGQILFEGRDITKARAAERRSLQGDLRAVFQDPFSSLNPRRPIGDALTEPLRVAGVPRTEREQRAREVLDAVGLAPGSETRFPRQFSGGQRQRISIARALVTDPRLVVCDEAVSALDLSTQAQVLNLLADLRAGTDLGYLFIAHDMAVVEFLAQRVVVLNRGRIVEQGRTGEVMRNPQHHYTRVLMAASPVPDPDEQARRREAWRALKASAAAPAA